jgi:hypothetical protein
MSVDEKARIHEEVRESHRAKAVSPNMKHGGSQ